MSIISLEAKNKEKKKIPSHGPKWGTNLVLVLQAEFAAGDKLWIGREGKQERKLKLE